MRPSLALLAILLLTPLLLAGTYLPPVANGPVYEGKTVRIPIGTFWADVRVYSLGISPGFAVCTGVGSGRTCGPCPVTEAATFIVTYWNGTEVRALGIAEGATGTVSNQFKIKVTKIEETFYIENIDSGTCNYYDARVYFEFFPFVECAADSGCPSGKGCANYLCVRSECNTNANCAADEECVFHRCNTVQRHECGEIRNHTWVDFQCCDSSACPSGQRCIQNTCRIYRFCSRNVDCRLDEYCSSATTHCEAIPSTSCGAYSNHSWVPYACCSNSDCPSGKRCINHECLGCTSDSDCPLNSTCRTGSCIELTGCGLIANHTLTPYECCSDSDCFEEFFCSNHDCIPVPCICGSIINHTCIPGPCPTSTPGGTVIPPSPTPAITPTPTPAATPTAEPTPAPSPTPTPAGIVGLEPRCIGAIFVIAGLTALAALLARARK